MKRLKRCFVSAARTRLLMRRHFGGGAVESTHRPFLPKLLWFDADGHPFFQQRTGRVLSLELALPDWKKRKNPPALAGGFFYYGLSQKEVMEGTRS